MSTIKSVVESKGYTLCATYYEYMYTNRFGVFYGSGFLIPECSNTKLGFDYFPEAHHCVLDQWERWDCLNRAGKKCVERCDDGYIVGKELCDTGRWNSSDYCSEDCYSVLPGYECDINPTYAASGGYGLLETDTD